MRETSAGREVILSVDNLSVDYVVDRVPIPACIDVSLQLREGEILGIAGESGSGKSTLLNALGRLQRPPAQVSAGSVAFRDATGAERDMLTLSERQLRALRWDEIAVVMQNAMQALNPVTRLRAQFEDVLRAHLHRPSKQLIEERSRRMLALVGVPPSRLDSYPHQLSGGTRQRVTIALALACEPRLVFFDEPTTAVDVVMQSAIMQHVRRLRDSLGFSAVFVTHDLSLLLEYADRIAIMYAGRIVETGTAEELYRNPLHPYTRGLRDSFPPLRGARQLRHGIQGSPPSTAHLPSGCAFHPRCDRALDICTGDVPRDIDTQDGRRVACVLRDPLLAEAVAHSAPLATGVMAS